MATEVEFEKVQAQVKERLEAVLKMAIEEWAVKGNLGVP